jgi:hypothetical protein
MIERDQSACKRVEECEAAIAGCAEAQVRVLSHRSRCNPERILASSQYWQLTFRPLAKPLLMSAQILVHSSSCCYHPKWKE